MIFLSSKAGFKLIKEVYEKPGINISSLLKSTKTSPQVGYKHIKEMIKSGIIKEEIQGKNVIRNFYPNFSDAGKAIFILIEESKKQEFLNSHLELKGPIS